MTAESTQDTFGVLLFDRISYFRFIPLFAVEMPESPLTPVRQCARTGAGKATVY
jgi:hypothetical protein